MIHLYRFLDLFFSTLYAELCVKQNRYWRWLDWLQAKAFNLRFRAENRREAKVRKWPM